MLITILNIYNPLNNIKFTKERKSGNFFYPIFDFLKIKYHTKIKDKDKSHHSPQSTYSLLLTVFRPLKTID